MKKREKLERLRRRTLRWYSQHGRKLAWRKTRDPYRIWISEVMLQQTQVSRVNDFYLRFLKRFPTLKSLAAARWNDVLPRWRGLGYYQRGRNVLAAAKILVGKHGGKFPRTFTELRALPGIGPYTANALLSFAFDEDVPAFDVNMKRVFSRIFGAKYAPEKTAQELFALSPGQGPALNHALMDLGATFCRARGPLCAACPVSSLCEFSINGAGKQPVSARKKKSPAIDVAAACIHRKGEYLLAKRSRKKGGEWEFPGGKRKPGEDIRHCLKREIKEELGVEVSVRPPFFVHEFKKNGQLYRLHFCRCQILRGEPKAKEHQKLVWNAPEDFSVVRIAETNRRAAAIL